MSAITFASLDAAMAATVRPVRLYCRIGGVPVDVWEATTNHSVDQPIGTCSVLLTAPRPASVAINAEIEIEAGYDGAVRRIFHGRVPNDESAIDDNGKQTRVDGIGWASYLEYISNDVIEITGPVTLKEAFRSLCELRNVPTYLADETTYVDGVTEITLGGNSQVDGGHVRIDSRTSPLSWLTRTAQLFGYRVFDSPDGVVRLARISGLPNETSSFTYAEGVNAYRFQNRRDVRPMVTYWEVKGARYEEEDGGVTEIRSIPATVPYAAELDPPGFRSDTVSDNVLVTSTLADGCRNVLEVDRSEVWTGETWECAGHPGLQPGDVVTVNSATLGVTSADRWLMRIDQSVSDRGYIANMEGWAGAGEALAAGNDCITEPIGTGVYHLGNQTISRYADPTADGTSVTIDITITNDDYSSLRLIGLGHGCNSYNNTTPGTGSVVEVWQLEDPTLPESGTNELRRVGSAELPTLDEHSNRAYDYGASDTYWSEISIPLPGTLKVGAAELRLISGTDSGDGQDDYEVKDLMLKTCGVGEPDLPSGGM